MTARSPAVLHSEINSQFPDNFMNLITAAVARPVLNDMVDSLQGIEVDVAQYGVVPDGTDQSANLQDVMDLFTTAGGATLHFHSGTYRANSILFRPNIILRGVGIDVTTIYVNVNDVDLFTGHGGAQSGFAGVENMTLKGYGLIDPSQGSGRLLNIGPFDLYWFYNVKGIYSRNMSLTGFGGIGICDHCLVQKSYRDAINLTATDYTSITNNEIDECGDDAIAVHVPSSANGIDDQAIRVIGNKIRKSWGIKLLGCRNAVVQGNTLRFYYGYGVNIGLDGSFDQGLITRFNINVNGNTFLDGLNGNTVGAGSIGYGIFLHAGIDLGTGGNAIPVNVGEYNPSTLKIQTPDSFINKAGIGYPTAQDGNISLVGNAFRQTINNITHFSDAGFGELWTNSGPLDPLISSLLGEVSGIFVADDIENTVIYGNTMHGVDNGIACQGQLNNVVISNNLIFRVANGIRLIYGGTLANGGVIITSNVIDCDPYLEHASRTQPIDGSWTVSDGSNMMCIWIQKYTGIQIHGNHFRNAIRAIKSVGAGNYVNEKNVCAFDWSGASNKGISRPDLGCSARRDIFWFCNSNPTSVNFQQYDQDFGLSTNGSQPNAGYYFHGTFVENSNPGLDASNMSILGWLRNTDGNTHVAGTDWITAYVSHVSPAT